MKNQITKFKSGALPRLLRATCIAGLVPVLVLLLNIQTSQAGSATWKLNPISGDWSDPANWTPETVPNSPADVAAFSVTNQTTVSISGFDLEVGGITFDAGANSCTITILPAYALTISGEGIRNNSGVAQSFAEPREGGAFPFLPQVIYFYNNATAGTSTFFTLDGSASSQNGWGYILFFDNSTAGNGSFIINGSPGGIDSSSAAYIEFAGSSTAAHGNFSANAAGGSGQIGLAGHVNFLETSTANNATLSANGATISGAYGGYMMFDASSSAGSSTLIANDGINGGFGGMLFFVSNYGVSESSTGGTARAELFGNGSLDITGHNPPGVGLGSIEGSGTVLLGLNNLTVGSNNLSTTFSGVIQDDPNIGADGSLTKIGTGTLTLSGANTYSGVTTVSAGTLLANTRRGSGTGSGKVKVNAGTLGGTGNLSGAVTIGKGNGPGAILSPGTDGPGTLTLKKTLTFKPDAVYQFELKNNNAKSDKVAARGVTISSGALFSFIGLGSGGLTQGTVFTVISNTSRSPITGTFSNLPDGSTFNANGNNFQASYEGGDGNDLTLTVVP